MDPKGDPGIRRRTGEGSRTLPSRSVIEELYRTLEDRGSTATIRQSRHLTVSSSVMYCHDPDGIIVELVEELKK